MNGDMPAADAREHAQVTEQHAEAPPRSGKGKEDRGADRGSAGHPEPTTSVVERLDRVEASVRLLLDLVKRLDSRSREFLDQGSKLAGRQDLAALQRSLIPPATQTHERVEHIEQSLTRIEGFLCVGLETRLRDMIDDHIINTVSQVVRKRTARLYALLLLSLTLSLGGLLIQAFAIY